MTDESREKPEECDFCGYETESLNYYRSGTGDRDAWLCEICESTPAGNVELYPRGHSTTDVDVLKAVIQVAWIVIDKLEERG
jgi:hypothetical protein